MNRTPSPKQLKTPPAPRKQMQNNNNDENNLVLQMANMNIDRRAPNHGVRRNLFNHVQGDEQ